MRQTQSGITVIGSSTVSTAADRVRLRIAVEQFAAGAAEALTRSSENARTLRAGLRGAGIAERSIQTAGLSVDVQWGERQKVVGYVARQRFSAVAENVEQAGELLETLGAQLGDAFRVEGVEVFAHDTSTAAAAARAAAYDDAVEQARALAQRSGRSLGEVRSVTTVMPADRPETYRGQTMAIAKAGSFAPGEIEVAEQVQVSWDWADSTA